MIRAIVPAAGRSRRMGAQKLLLPYAGTTVLGHIIDQLLESSLDGVTVVVGPESPGVKNELTDRPVELATNPDPAGEMLSSVRCGLRALPHCDAVLLALGDQPSVTSRLVDAMLSAYGETEKDIVVPVHEGRRGHPLLFSDRFRGEVQTSFDDVGLRGLLRAHPDEVCELSVSASAVLSDMDHPADYLRELARLDEDGSGHS